MVSKGYASKIIAYDDNTVDMFIKPENIVDVFGKDANKVGRSPSVNVKIGSMEALDKFLDEEQDSGNFTGSISYEKQTNYFGMIFWNIAPFLLLIGIWMFAMRRMSGGGGPGGAGSVFSVGKVKHNFSKRSKPHHFQGCCWSGSSQTGSRGNSRISETTSKVYRTGRKDT